MLRRFYYVVAGLVCAVILLGCSDDEIDGSKLDGLYTLHPTFIQLVNEEGENILLKNTQNSLYGQKLIIRRVGSDTYENVSWSGPLTVGGGSGQYDESGHLIGLSTLISRYVPDEHMIEFPDIKKYLYIRVEKFVNGFPQFTVNNHACEQVQDSTRIGISAGDEGFAFYLTINFWDVAADSE